VTTINPPQAAAIVTGHSRGIGEAIAEHLLTRGTRVLGISRNANDRLAARFAELQEVTLDIADFSALQRWLGTPAMKRFLDGAEVPLLVNNAGVLQPIGPMETQNLDLVARAVAVNVGAVFVLSAAFTQATAAKERRILQVSSGAGRKAYAGWSIYCATKAALDHHARCVALDGTPGLLISSVAPGVVDTHMQAEIRASTDDRFPDRPRFVAMHKDKALPSPEQTGGKLVDYLLSDLFGAEPVFDLRDFTAAETR
jgi:NAD(P)-dependent dehydrogenase (short-subunit alcohol dehydrogenase family)